MGKIFIHFLPSAFFHIQNKRFLNIIIIFFEQFKKAAVVHIQKKN